MSWRWVGAPVLCCGVQWPCAQQGCCHIFADSPFSWPQLMHQFAVLRMVLLSTPVTVLSSSFLRSRHQQIRKKTDFTMMMHSKLVSGLQCSTTEWWPGEATYITFKDGVPVYERNPQYRPASEYKFKYLQKAQKEFVIGPTYLAKLPGAPDPDRKARFYNYDTNTAFLISIFLNICSSS